MILDRLATKFGIVPAWDLSEKLEKPDPSEAQEPA